MPSKEQEPPQTARAAGADKRKFTRYPLYLPAQVSFEGGVNLGCTIRDYCRGGMFIAWGEPVPGEVAAIERGSVLEIAFEVGSAPQASRYKVLSRVARVLAGGVGVTFEEVDPAALDALENTARQGAGVTAASGRRADVDAEAVIARCKQIVSNRVNPMLSAFFKRVDETLFLAARDASNNIEQRALFDTMTLVQNRKEELAQTVHDGIVENMDHLGERQEADAQPETEESDGSLSLVEKDEFEELLIIADIVTRAESQYKDQLWQIETRLSQICDGVVDRSNDPIGPSVICRTISKAIDTLELEPAHLRLIYDVLADSVVPALDGLFSEFDGYLARQGLESARPPEPKRVVRRPRGGEAPAAALDSAGAETVSGAEQTQGGAAAPAAAATAAPAVAPSAPSAPTAPTAPTAAGQLQVPAAGAAAAPAAFAPAAYEAARALLDLQRRLAGAPGTGPAAPAAAQVQGGPPTALFSSSEVVDAVNLLEQEDQGPWGEETQGEDFHQRLLKVLASRNQGAGVPKSIASEQSDAIQMVGGMLASLKEDALFPRALKPQIRHLQGTLHKLALADPSFLSDQAHPARQVLNRVAELQSGADGPGDDEELQAGVQQLLSRVSAEFDANPSVFSDVLGELDRLAERQQAEFERNKEAVVSACQAQEAAAKAERGDQAAETPKEARTVSKEWELWLKRAQQLRIGDPLSLKRGAGEPQRVALAWTGDDANRFVFVNAKGQKVASMTRQELAMQLRRGSALPLEQSDIPAADRALFTTLYKMQDQIGRQALQDSLTGLVNRKKFLAILEKAVAEAGKGLASHVLGVMELGGMESLQARAGTRAGEALLKKLSVLLDERLAEAVVLARIDESAFGFLFEKTDLDMAQQRGREMVELSAKIRVRYKDEKFSLNPCVGLVKLLGAGEDAEQLIAAARKGCATAREAGTQLSVAALGEDAAGAAAARVDWREWFDRTLAGDTVELRCQRIRAVAADATEEPYCELVVGSEQESGLVPVPAGVLQSSEFTEQARALDRLVIRESLKWMGTHGDILENLAGCAINLSSASIADPSLMEFVLEQLTESMVPPGKLCFEISQAAVNEYLSETEQFMRTLKEFGCRFSLDEFGAGETAKSDLNNLPVDYLKIDGLFVGDLDQNDNDYAVVKSINEIGRLMGKKTIAVEVSREGILARLREIGVDYAQGAVIADPCLLDDVA